MTTKAMRAAFEAHSGPMGFDLRRQSVAVPEPWAEYVDLNTGHRWAGWIAATEIERRRCLSLIYDLPRLTRLEISLAIRKGEKS